MTRAAYSIDSAAQLYDVSRDTIVKALHTTSLTGPNRPLYAKKIGNKWLISAEALEEWFNSLPDA